MTFFYDLNKKLAALAAKQQLAESAEPVAERATGDYSAKKAAAGKDIGKPGKMFSKIAKSAGERYGSKERGEKVAGAVLAKLRAKESVEEADDHKETKLIRDLRAKGLSDKEIIRKMKELKHGTTKTVAKEDDMDESALQAYLGKKKYGETGMKALQKAGREHAGKEKMAKIRAKYDKMDEADMEEGNKFTGNLMKARAAGLKKADLDGDGDMETVRETAKPDYIDLDKDGNRKEAMKKAAMDAKKHKVKKEDRSKGTAFDPEVAKGMFAHKDDSSRYDVKDTGYSKRYTRKAEPETDEPEVSDQPKKRGRPKGPAKGPERVTAKAWKHKGVRKEKTEEDLDTDGVMMNRPSNMSSESIEDVNLADKGEYDQEGDMAKDQLHTLTKAAEELASILDDDQNLPEWVQSKITKAMDYIRTANDYMDQERHDADKPIAEKAVSKAQRKAAGIAYAAAKGEIPKKELRGASKEMAKMGKGELKKFAKTKEKGLPEKVKEADTENKPAKSGGYQFGKGVYESLDKKYKQALTEGMNISVNMNTGPDGQPSKNITVSADGEDAESLAQLLKMAGINGQSQEACPACGSSDCGCESIDENSPDWPTNKETMDADPNLRTYSGGLNGPKSTGQTTTPVIASQLRRQVSMDESVELERSLFKLYQNYKAQ